MPEPTDTTAELIAPPPGVPNPLLLIAELTYRCPLHCPYCSNPTDIGAGKYQDELPAEDWQRGFREAADLGTEKRPQIAECDLLLPSQETYPRVLRSTFCDDRRCALDPRPSAVFHAQACCRLRWSTASLEEWR